MLQNHDRFTPDSDVFLICYNPLRDEQGRIVRWDATGTDIEDRKQAEEKTRMQNEYLALREEIDRSSMF